MDQAADEIFDDLLETEAAADWQARLTAAFFDAEGPGRGVAEGPAAAPRRRRARAGARAAGGGGLPAGEPAGREPLRQRVIRHLVGVASRDATAPARDPE